MAQTKTRSRKASAAGSISVVDQYLYSVGWSEEDEAYIARVAEFPSLAARGESQEAALHEIRKVVRAVLKDLAADIALPNRCFFVIL
jgi:predicted RNase H-like HicB family nuclease